jgi:hypothetical protein
LHYNTRPVRRCRPSPLARAPPADFVARIRDELTDTLARVREAAALPWRDLTTATLAELRFNSIAGWLPEDEASALRAAFQCEINRLYIIAETDDKAQAGSNEKYFACRWWTTMAEVDSARRRCRTGSPRPDFSALPF